MLYNKLHRLEWFIYCSIFAHLACQYFNHELGHQRAGKSQLSKLTFSESALPKPLRCCHTHTLHHVEGFQNSDQGWHRCGVESMVIRSRCLFSWSRDISMYQKDSLGGNWWMEMLEFGFLHGVELRQSFFWKHRSSWKEGLGMVPPVLAVRLGAEAVGGGKDMERKHAKCIFLRFPWQ